MNDCKGDDRNAHRIGALQPKRLSEMPFTLGLPEDLLNSFIYHPIKSK
jgi:hypothetical protein